MCLVLIKFVVLAAVSAAVKQKSFKSVFTDINQY